MAEDTFDGLKDELENSLFKEKKSLKEIVGILTSIRPILDPSVYEIMLSEISLIGNRIREVITCSDKLYDKAIRDGVTGLHTRAYLDEYVELAQSVQKRGHINLAYVMSDVDFFGRYNEVYDHLQGDIALKCVADIFRLTLENTLIYGENLFTAKYGGEEFCAFIENFQLDENKLFIRLENIRRNIENIEIHNDECINLPHEGYKKVSITIVGGIIKPEEYIKTLMSRVDNILKDKGNRGRNKVYISE